MTDATSPHLAAVRVAGGRSAVRLQREQRVYRLTLLGRQLSVRSASDEGHVERVAELLEERIEEVRRGRTGVDPVEIALLAALNLAEEAVVARDELAEHGRSLVARAEKLCELVDAHL